MWCAVGKIGLYVAGGGFHPDHSLPAQLDCGTDTKSLLEDKFYLVLLRLSHMLCVYSALVCTAAESLVSDKFRLMPHSQVVWP